MIGSDEIILNGKPSPVKEATSKIIYNLYYSVDSYDNI